MVCPICGESSRQHVRHGSFQYFRCDTCFTSFLSPQPSTQDLDAFYARYHQQNGIYEAFDSRMCADFPLKARLAESVCGPSGRCLLDVGCGKGFFVKAASDSGMVAEGIDVSTSGVEYAGKVLNVKATVGRIEDFATTWQNKYDVITLWATIEHLDNPAATLRAIYACLKPGGTLLCDTGLGNSAWEAILAGHSQWYDAPQHLFVFSEEGLKILLRNAGFSMVRVDLNFERNALRRWAKSIRHAFLALTSYVLYRPLLGKRGFKMMQSEAKWPIGKLLSVVARKPNN